MNLDVVLLSFYSLFSFSASIMTFYERNKRFGQLNKIDPSLLRGLKIVFCYLSTICHIECLFLISFKI